MLNTGHPMYIWWGPDGCCLYNDAYAPRSVRNAIPARWAAPRQVWAEIWDIIGPQIAQVMAGAALPGTKTS